MFAYFLQENRLGGLIGIFIFLLIAFIFSNNKRKINLRTVLGAFVMQVLLALFMLNTEIGRIIFSGIAAVFGKLYTFADAGINFVFGNLGNTTGSWGFIFIVKVVPVIIFLSALVSILFHYKIMQFIVRGIGFLIKPILGTSGAETLCATANSMLGPLESPLLVKKYVKGMTESEILTVMISGMATISVSVMVFYGSIGVPMVHLLAASVMSVPGALLITKILVPETKTPETSAGSTIEMPRDSANVFDAISLGAMDGLGLCGGMVAMLIAFLSIMSLLDYTLLFTTGYGLNFLFAKFFSTVSYLLGISPQDSGAAGTLLGQKLVLNELIAYVNFVKMQLADKSKIILTYALCGFANFSVIGILLGGVSAMAPNQRAILSKFGLRALLGGTLVNFLNAAIVSLLI